MLTWSLILEVYIEEHGFFSPHFYSIEQMKKSVFFLNKYGTHLPDFKVRIVFFYLSQHNFIDESIKQKQKQIVQFRMLILTQTGF